MKRLTYQAFFNSESREDATPETPWRYSVVRSNAKTEFTLHAMRYKERKEISELLGFGDDDGDWNWYHSYSLNPLNDLPLGVVLDKINRAAEHLGILEED